MRMNGKTFVGFGFGPIQSGLFVYEAMRSGNFGRMVVAEIDAAVAGAIRAAEGFSRINVAHKDGITTERVGPVELLNPAVEADRIRLIAAIADADELATALPSVEFYGKGGAASVACLLAQGMRNATQDRQQILYAAENHNHAAEILREEVAKAIGGPVPERVQFLNTVIGKMSGIIADEAEQQRLGLAPLAPGIPRAVLVEEFNRILISRIRVPGFSRGIAVFEEKTDLLPFEEAKLYGHNAIHALLGYLAHERGYRTMAEAGKDAGLMKLARDAFLLEAGVGLIHRHRGIDPLFTSPGFQTYADDLLARMTNPFLSDSVARVIRDPYRKLGWDDRLVGAMRLALEAGVKPVRLAAGVRAALLHGLRESWPAEARDRREAELLLKALGLDLEFSANSE